MKDFAIGKRRLVTWWASNKLEHRGNDPNKMYFIISHQDDTILVPQTQGQTMRIVLMKIQLSYQKQTSNLDETSQVSPQLINWQSSYDEENKINDIFKELQSFKDFQSSVENKLIKKEDVIISNCRYHSHTQWIGPDFWLLIL